MVQPASREALHCYARDGALFDARTPARVLARTGVHAHLITAGRLQEQWCLVLEADRPVVQDNAEALHQLVRRVGQELGFTQLQLRRHVERRDEGLAIDLGDWLKL